MQYQTNHTSQCPKIQPKNLGPILGQKFGANITNCNLGVQFQTNRNVSRKAHFLNKFGPSKPTVSATAQFPVRYHAYMSRKQDQRNLMIHTCANGSTNFVLKLGLGILF